MQIDPILSGLVVMALAIVILGFFLRLFRQPHVIGYIVAGVLLGVLGLTTDKEFLSQAGNLGVILLLFFIGMHIDIEKLIRKWRVAILGTAAQILLTLLVVWILGMWLAWPLPRVLLFAFAVSLSSTAVILKILEQWGELETKVGQNVLSILLVQDLAIIPMILILEFAGGNAVDYARLALQIVGGILLIGLVSWIVHRRHISIPWVRRLKKDKELKVFLALVLCFGLALLTGLFGLSTALGAFAAGIIVSAAKESGWVHDHLEPIHDLLVALFFVYVGTLIDLAFLREHLALVLMLVLAILALNTVLNTAILRLLGDNWRESLYAGALLSQIGEFSFLLATIGLSAGIIAGFGYQLMILAIALTLLVSPLWIQAIKRLLHIDAGYVFELPGMLLGKK